MNLPDHREWQDKHYNISDDVGQTRPTKIGVDVETMTARDVVIPQIFERYASEESCDGGGNAVRSQNRSQNPASDPVRRCIEDAEVDGQNGEFGEQDCREIQYGYDEDKLGPDDYFVRIGAFESSCVIAHAASEHIS